MLEENQEREREREKACSDRRLQYPCKKHAIKRERERGK